METQRKMKMKVMRVAVKMTKTQNTLILKGSILSCSDVGVME